MNLLRTTNALNLQDFPEHFDLTLLSILHPRYNSISAENRMGDMLSHQSNLYCEAQTGKKFVKIKLLFAGKLVNIQMLPEFPTSHAAF